MGPTRGCVGDSQAPSRGPLPPPPHPPSHACAVPGRIGEGVGRGEGATSKPILISPVMSAGRRLEKASGTLNKKNVANAIIEGEVGGLGLRRSEPPFSEAAFLIQNEPTMGFTVRLATAPSDERHSSGRLAYQ